MVVHVTWVQVQYSLKLHWLKYSIGTVQLKDTLAQVEIRYMVHRFMNRKASKYTGYSYGAGISFTGISFTGISITGTHLWYIFNRYILHRYSTGISNTGISKVQVQVTQVLVQYKDRYASQWFRDQFGPIWTTF